MVTSEALQRYKNFTSLLEAIIYQKQIRMLFKEKEDKANDPTLQEPEYKYEEESVENSHTLPLHQSENKTSYLFASIVVYIRKELMHSQMMIY